LILKRVKRVGVVGPFTQLLALWLAASSVVSASVRDDVWSPPEKSPVWQSECGACHVAFPPTLLHAEDWSGLLERLDQHFGVDASLDPAVKSDISEYLRRNGASQRAPRSTDELPRITTTDRFVDKHRGAIRLWRRGSLKSPSNCAACHTEAAAN
jgi:hypothetical protein